MNFTDVFIRKPVLAIVVSLLILGRGQRARIDIEIHQFTKTENTDVLINTSNY